jgi:pyruvate formate lyase activating enzyme
MGQKYTIPQLMEIIKRDMVFYRRSGGGVTFSGGEATWQPEFLNTVASRCSELGIDLALETCGYFKWEKVKDTLKMMDLIFLDIKHTDPLVHLEHTGKDNNCILENAQRISEEGIPLVIRIPVIPGINDTPENISNTAEFVKESLPSCIRMELLPYHALGKDKYRSLGKTYMLEDLSPPPDAEMDILKGIVEKAGVKVLTF